MPTREQLQEAYLAFRLPVGSDWKTIKKRYKLLVNAWHPDKQGGSIKEEVQQELKEYNHFYNDIFKIHFESEHSEDPGCICQPVQEAPQEPVQEEFQQEGQAYEPTEQIDPEIEARSQRRRWQASACVAVAFVAIIAYGFIGGKIKSMMPAPKIESINSQSIPVSAPSINSPAWRAPYQSISTPITPSATQAIPAQNQQKLDDTRRAITVNENKMTMLQQDIESFKAQIKMANPASAGMLYRELGSKEQELASLRQRTQYLKMELNQQ